MIIIMVSGDDRGGGAHNYILSSVFTVNDRPATAFV